MISIYLLLIAGLSIYDIYSMKKEVKPGRDIFVYTFFMTSSAVLGVVYLVNSYRTGLAEVLLNLFKARW